MGAFPLFEDKSASLKEIFSDMPNPVRSSMTRGFSIIGSLNVSQKNVLEHHINENLSSVSDIDVETLAGAMKLEEDAAASVISAITLLIALISTRSESADSLVGDLIDAGLISHASHTTSLEIARNFSGERETLQRSMRMGSLATRTLPSFRSLETSVDLRLEVRADSVDLVVPSVIAHLRTDLSTSNSFFQLKKSDIKQLIEQMSRLMREIEIAEAWSKERR